MTARHNKTAAAASLGIEDDELLRMPPVNFEAEVQLLGAILANNRSYEAVADFLKPEHFADSRHAHIFDACGKLIARGQVASAVTLNNYFAQDSTLAEIGGTPYLGKLAASAVTVINAGDHGRIIQDLHVRRQLIGIGEDVVNRAYAHDLETSGAQQILIAESALIQLTDLGSADGALIRFGAAAQSALTSADAAGKRESGLIGVDTGMDRINEMTGGMEPELVYILGARPSMGKTALAMKIATSVARTGEPVAFYSLEMSAEQLARREAAAMCDIDLMDFKNGRLTSNDWDRLTEAQRRIEGLPLYIDDRARLTAAQIRSSVRKLQRKLGKPLGLVVIDHLTIMGPPPEQRGMGGKVQEVGANSGLVKAIAKDLKVPVLLLCQLSRANEQREDRRPQLSDLRWAGEVEQDADTVMFIHREAYYLERNKPVKKLGEKPQSFSERITDHETALAENEGKAEVIFGKQRDGPVGVVYVGFRAKTARFHNLETT